MQLKPEFKKIRDRWLPYSRQSIDDKDIDCVSKVLRSDWLTQGPKVEGFEKSFARFIGARFAVAFSNGTQALVAAQRAAKVGMGDQTLCPSMTFAATPNSSLLVGAKPQFCDINPSTGHMDPDELEKRISSKTRCVLPVHYGGGCCDMDVIMEISKNNGSVVIEDACHAIGAKYKGLSAGTLADMSVFSFHPVKPMTSGEGGMVTTNSHKFYEKLKALATHGIFKDGACVDVGPWYYEMRLLGANGRMSELHAALGQSQLGKLNIFQNKRTDLAKRYDRLFTNNNYFTPLKIAGFTKSSYHLYPVLVEMDKLNCGKKLLVESLHRMNIGVQVHYIPVHLHPYYKKLGYDDKGLFKTLEFYKKVISLPIFVDMTKKDQDDVMIALDLIIRAFGK